MLERRPPSPSGYSGCRSSSRCLGVRAGRHRPANRLRRRGDNRTRRPSCLRGEMTPAARYSVDATGMSMEMRLRPALTVDSCQVPAFTAAPPGLCWRGGCSSRGSRADRTDRDGLPSLPRSTRGDDVGKGADGRPRAFGKIRMIRSGSVQALGNIRLFQVGSDQAPEKTRLIRFGSNRALEKIRVFQLGSDQALGNM